MDKDLVRSISWNVVKVKAWKESSVDRRTFNWVLGWQQINKYVTYTLEFFVKDITEGRAFEKVSYATFKTAVAGAAPT